MKLGRVVILAIAILAAIGAGFIAVNMASAPQPEAVVLSVPNEPQIELAEILVTRGTIGMGSNLGESMVWRQWPVEGIDPSFIRRDARPEAIEELKSSVARQSFFDGEPVREAKLIRSDRGFLSAILPSGKRAVAIQISADTSAGGFILPNDHVDVIMTRRIEDRYDTETILRNLRVLAIDQTIEEQDGARVVVGSTATLEVDSPQAEALTVAQQMADRLVLSLRSLADSAPGGKGYADFLLNQEQPERSRMRIVRYGQTTDIVTRN